MRQHVVEMVGGPGTLRFFLQPAVAVMLGVLHGIRDWRTGRPPSLSGLLRARDGRWHAEGLKAIAVPLCVALLASFTFQYIIRSRVYVIYGILYAALFVAIPYRLTRGLTNHFALQWRGERERRSGGGDGWRASHGGSR
jgi:hypothetical protein